MCSILSLSNNGRVASAFDLAVTTNTVGAPALRFFAKGGSQKCRRKRVDHFSTTKSNSARRNAAHPCGQRKIGPSSVGTAHAKFVKRGPPVPTKMWYTMEETWKKRGE